LNAQSLNARLQYHARLFIQSLFHSHKNIFRMLVCTLECSYNGRLLTIMLTWTNVQTQQLITNGFTLARIHKRKLDRMNSEPSGNLDRSNGSPTLQRVRTWATATGKVSTFVWASVQHFWVTCGEASLHLHIDDWEKVQEPKTRSSTTSMKLCSIVCTPVQNCQRPCAVSRHIQSSVRSPAHQCSAAAEQRR
jgi:hypothetical protein